MKCYKCKYYRAGMISNKCELFGFENYYTDNDCDLINDDFTVNKENRIVFALGWNEEVETIE